jgi:hypothetical protein
MRNISHSLMRVVIAALTFNPYCSFAINGFSDMKLKSFLFQVNGRGMMRVMKMTISATNRRKT